MPNVVMMGATGAVGGEAVKQMLLMPEVTGLTLLGRRDVESFAKAKVAQHKISIFEPASYSGFLAGHEAAVCTLGVGEPSKVSNEDFLKIDKQAVIDFARECHSAGVKHFSLLSSVGVDAGSSSFFLRTKGELIDEVIALGFERFSVFQPSMILTPTNRYGVLQGITLAVFPLLKPLLFGSLRKYRGIPVSVLGGSMARNLLVEGRSVEYLVWDDFYERTKE